MALGSSHALYAVLATGHPPHTASQPTAQLSSYSVPAAGEMEPNGIWSQKINNQSFIHSVSIYQELTTCDTE